MSKHRLDPSFGGGFCHDGCAGNPAEHCHCEGHDGWRGCKWGNSVLMERLIAENARVVRMLRRLEWRGTPESGGRARCCPECDEFSPDHYPGCELAALLKDLPEEP